jgi:hypothetical protein
MKNGPQTRMDTGLLDANRSCVNLLTDTNVRANPFAGKVVLGLEKPFPNGWREGCVSSGAARIVACVRRGVAPGGSNDPPYVDVLTGRATW